MSMRTTRTTRLKQLVEQREEINARIRMEQNRERATERKLDTRRKVLAGATVLEWAKRDSDFARKLDSEMRAFLVRDADRELFSFPPLTPTAQARPKVA